MCHSWPNGKKHLYIQCVNSRMNHTSNTFEMWIEPTNTIAEMATVMDKENDLLTDIPLRLIILFNVCTLSKSMTENVSVCSYSLYIVYPMKSFANICNLPLYLYGFIHLLSLKHIGRVSMCCWKTLSNLFEWCMHNASTISRMNEQRLENALSTSSFIWMALDAVGRLATFK